MNHITVFGLFLCPVLAIAAVFVLEGCPPSSPPVNPPDADGAPAPLPTADVTTVTVTVTDAAVSPALAPCVSACINLRAIKCSEGFGVDGGDSCEAVCAHTLGGAFDMKPACLSAAKDIAGARACATVRCR